MRRILSFLILGALVAAAAFPARAALLGSARFHGSIDRDFTVGRSTSVSITIASGDLDLRAVDVQRQASRAGIAAHTVQAGGIVHLHGDVTADSQQALADVTITTQQRGSQYEISIREPHWKGFFGKFNSRYTIAYPSTLALDVDDSSGDVRIYGPRNAVTVQSSSGDVSVQNPQQSVVVRDSSGDVAIRGALSTLDAHASSGDVTASLAPGWAGSSIALSSSSGDIRLSVPRGFHAAVNAHTASGSVRVAGGVLQSGGTPVRLFSSSGDVIVK